MKKSNVILQAAVASALMAMVGASQATTVSTLTTAPVFAKELLQGSTPNATALIIPAANAISITSNVSIPANSTVYVYVKLSGASIKVIPTVIPAAALTATKIAHSDGSGAALGSFALTAVDLGSTTGTANPTAVGAGVDYLVFQVNTNADVVGVGAELVRIGVATPLQIDNATALLTAPVTVTASIGIGAPTSRFGALAASASNHDTTSTAVNVATSAQGITVTAAADTSTTAKIDLTATPVATLFTGAINTNTIQLGSITATNGTAKQADGATAYTIASQAGAATTLVGTVTAPAGFFAPLGTTGQLWLQPTSCTAAGVTGAAAGTALAASASTVFTTTALAAAATSVAMTATTGVPVSGTVYGICMGITKTIAAIEGTPSFSGSLKHTATAVDSDNAIAAISLYALTKNGSTKYVRNYVPAALTGYPMTVRVSNTGSVAAPVTITMTGEDGAQKGTAYTTTQFAVGETRRILQSDIETGTGYTPAATERPRLTVTAPTNTMDVQTFINTPGHGFTNLSGTE